MGPSVRAVQGIGSLGHCKFCVMDLHQRHVLSTAITELIRGDLTGAVYTCYMTWNYPRIGLGGSPGSGILGSAEDWKAIFLQ